jgi:hypothetical protein
MAIKSLPNAERSTQVFTLKRPQKRDQFQLLLRRQLGAEDQVEELDRVLQSQKPLVVQIGRVVLGAAQRKGFDRSVPDRHHVVDHHRLEEALGLSRSAALRHRNRAVWDGGPSRRRRRANSASGTGDHADGGGRDQADLTRQHTCLFQGGERVDTHAPTVRSSKDA